MKPLPTFNATGFDLKLFAGDLKSVGATKYDAAGLAFYWLPFLSLSPLFRDELAEPMMTILFGFGLFASAVMAGYLSVWTIRPLIAALAASVITLVLGAFSVSFAAAVIALLAFGVRAYNSRRSLAPHPFFQPDAFHLAFYNSGAGVARET